MSRALRSMRALAAAVALFSAAAHAELAVLDAAQWQQARAGAQWEQLEPLARTVAAFDAAPGSRIVVRFPGGDAGNAWAREVRDRLVAMGVASGHIELQPGSGFADALVLETVAAP